MLRLQHLSFNFGSNWALRDINLVLEAGEFLFVTGPSGAGKTTLLRMLYADLPVDRGQALVAGFNLRNMSAGRIPMLRRKVGVVFQDFKILPRRTVYDNVAMALEVRGMAPRLIERRVRAVLRPLKLEAKVAEPCEALSGGEQQRVAVARAMVVNPSLILADEPTGNLDPELSTRLLDVFRQFHAFGTTVVMATHSAEMVEAMPEARVMHLVNGQTTYANWDGARIAGQTASMPTATGA